MSGTQQDHPRRLLLVEGNDKFFIEQLNIKHRVPKDAFEVVKKDGVVGVLDALEFHLAIPETETVGVLVDADKDAAKRWSEVRDILAGAGYVNLPGTPALTGTTIRQPGKPDVGCWIMPDNQLPGALEDFVRVLVPEGDDLWPLSETTVDGIEAAKRRFTDNDLLKAVVHTWLAWQKEPGTPIGMAVQRKYLDANAGPAMVLVAWLKDLFAVDPQEAK